jgi:hypothetical protein
VALATLPADGAQTDYADGPPEISLPTKLFLAGFHGFVQGRVVALEARANAHPWHR